MQNSAESNYKLVEGRLICANRYENDSKCNMVLSGSIWIFILLLE